MRNWICINEFLNLVPVNPYKKELQAINKCDGFFKNLHVIFRKKWSLEKKQQKYFLKITADDYYKLYINGIYIGQGPANAYHRYYNYNTYDITDYIINGENIIAVDTYYNGLINRAYNSGDLRQGLWVEIYVDNYCLLVTDETWRYKINTAFDRNVETIGYDTQFIENIDMTRSLGDWKSMDFDDGEWEKAVIKENDDHILFEQITPPVEVKEIFPENIKYFNSNNYLLDFGKELVGCIKLVTKSFPKCQVKIFCGEELQNNGHVKYDMRCNVCYSEIWTLSGNLDFIENYDYKGFRFIEIITDDDNVVPEHFSVLKQQYPITNKCEFNSSVDMLNKIWSICENAVIISSQESFLDCPTREKGQYLGDLTVTSLAHSYISGDTKLYKKALTDFANSAFICKGLMAVVPGSFMQEIADFSLLYPLQLYNYYNLTGDKEFVRNFLPIAEAAVDYFCTYQREDGLLECVKEKWNLVDWPENLRDNYDFELTKPIGMGCHNVINAYFYGAMLTINIIRNIFGFGDKYDTQKFRKVFIKTFYNKEFNLFVDSEGSSHSSLHANALPLFYKMVTSIHSGTIADFIINKGLCCGVFFSYFLLKGLTNYGRYQEVLDLILNDSQHSWVNMISEGATSCFEAWGKEQKWNTSLCHPWGSAPIILIIEDILGINIIEGRVSSVTPHIPNYITDIKLDAVFGNEPYNFYYKK